jgi:hypothetical protein
MVVVLIVVERIYHELCTIPSRRKLRPKHVVL